MRQKAFPFCVVTLGERAPAAGSRLRESRGRGPDSRSHDGAISIYDKAYARHGNPFD